MSKKMDEPAYKVVKEDIVADILSGIYPVGSAIKGQEYYAEKFQISRTTVRRAFEELIERGLLHSVKGKGTYVKSRTAFLPTTLPPSKEEHHMDFPTASFKIIQIKFGSADKRIAKQLGIAEGDPVICIERLKLIDKVAGNYQISYLNARLVENVNFMAEDLENGSLYRLLIHKAKLVPHHSDETIRAVGCPEEIAEFFGMEEGTPVLFI
ncbi:MAG: GntR family transcriptional regulator, partial [Angelakisella sp.]